MTIFKEQKIYCNACGVLFVGVPQGGLSIRGIVCSPKCRKVLELKHVYYVMGKNYEDEEALKNK